MSTRIAAMVGGMRSKYEAERQRARLMLASADRHQRCAAHIEVVLPLLAVESEDATVANGFAHAIYQACPICATEARELPQIEIEGVSARNITSTLGNFEGRSISQADALLAVRGILSAPTPLLPVIAGPGSSGKTHLAVGALRQLGSGKIITHDAMLQEVRGRYKADTSHRFTEELVAVENLAIDAFGIRVPGQDEVAILNRVIMGRVELGRRTWVTTGFDWQALIEEGGLGVFLADRLAPFRQMIPCVAD